MPVENRSQILVDMVSGYGMKGHQQREKTMRYLVPVGVPFSGHAQNILLDDGTVAWPRGVSLAEYEAQNGKMNVLTEADLEVLLELYTDSLIADPTEETAEAFDYALGCLPPARFGRVDGVTMFHISERITQDLVDWHCQAGGRSWTFTDYASRSGDYIAAKVLRAASADLATA
jgi:hypothetical protein